MKNNTNTVMAWVAVFIIGITFYVTTSNPIPLDNTTATSTQISQKTLDSSSVKTGNTTSQPKVTIKNVSNSPPVTEPTEITQFSCGIAAEFKADKAWMRACILQGTLTQACRQLYDSEGDYIPAKNGLFDGPNPFGDPMKQYLNDKASCSCSLPTALAKQLNDNFTSDVDLCKYYPKTTKAQDAAYEKLLEIMNNANNNSGQ